MQPDSSSLALSELLGKVIVVDVWATWCSPCRMMMPYFKQLEKELEGEEVEFLSVCIGTSIEWDSWKEIIATEELAGHLIFINSWTKGFAKEYRIVGVPRFLICFCQCTCTQQIGSQRTDFKNVEKIMCRMGESLSGSPFF